MSYSNKTKRYRRDLRAGAFALLCALLLSACQSQASEDQASAGEAPVSSVGAAPAAAPSPLPAVAPVPPVLQGTIPEDKVGEVESIVQAVRAVPGVAAVARVALGNASTESTAGTSDISIAAVDPIEFRPLAPAVTSNAEFVWRGLLSGELFLAHEEHERLGVRPGQTVFLKTQWGFFVRRVGGVAANGAPNLAGAMLSLQQAARIGITKTSFLAIGVGQGQSIDTVLTTLKKSVPSVTFQKAPWLVQKTFITGPNAARAFGSFSYIQNEDGTIAPDPAWVKKNIIKSKVPILGDVVCHRLMIPQLKAALAEIESEGAASAVDVSDFHYQGGCFVPRLVRGTDPGRSVSMHAWGLAVDINVKQNPAGAPSRMDPRVVAAFERWGFRWGGRWSPPDAHHFELAALVQK